MVSNRYFHFKNKHFFLSEDSYGYKIEQFINDAENLKLKQYHRRPNGFIILLRCWMEECSPSWPNGPHSSQMLDGRMPSFLARRMRLSSLSPIPRILPQMA